MSIKFENKNVTVDATRYVVNGKTYPINNITSVETGIIKYQDIINTERFPAKSKWAKGLYWVLPIAVFFGLIALIGLIANIFPGYLDEDGGTAGKALFSALLYAPIIAGIIGWIMSKKLYSPSYKRTHREEVPDDYAVRITTASGQVDSYQSKDDNIVNNIVEAINEAIIERG